MYLQKIISRKNSFLLASLRSRTKIAGSGAGSGSIVQRRGSGSLPSRSTTLFNTLQLLCLSLGVDLMAGRLKRGAVLFPPLPHHTFTLLKISGVLVTVTSPTHCQRSQVCWLLLPHLHTVKDLRFVGYCYLTYTLSKISGLLVDCYLTYTLSKISCVLVTVTSPTHCQRSQVCWLLLPHVHTVKDLRFVGWLLPHLHTVKDLRCVGYCYPHLHTVKDLRCVVYCYLTYTLSTISGLLVTVTPPTHCQRSQVCRLLLPHLHTVKDLRCVGFCYLTSKLSKISGVLVTVTSPTHCQRSQVCWLLLPHLHTVKDLRCVGYC